MTGKNDSMAMLGWKIPLTLLIWSVIVIGACSDTSPLYSFYPSPDPSIFFMFGRGLLHGLLPYVEMADSKGPLLVWIYYAAAWIDGHSFAGIFLIQCVTLFTTLLLACGTARFYLSQRGSLLASMLLCLFLFDSFPFQRGGGVEELCWPGMAAVVYGLVRYFRMRDRRSLLFLFGTAGVFAGAASMMKFSIAFPVCALGGVLCLWLWWNGRRKEAAVALGVALAGFLAVVVPCSAWLVSNGVWKEAMNEYLLCSVRYGTVSQDTTWWARLLRPAPVRCLSDVLMWVAVIWALAIAGWRQLKTQKALLFTALLYIFFKVEMFSVYNYYYNSILSPMMIWVTIFFVARGGTALFPVHAADGGRNAGNRLPHGDRSGCRADGRRPERRLCLEWQGVLFPRRPGTAGLFFRSLRPVSGLAGQGLRHYLGLEAVRKILVPSKLPVGGNGQGAV